MARAAAVPNEDRTRDCHHCERVLPFESFGSKNKAKFGRREVCKACAASLRRERWLAIPEEERREILWSNNIRRLYGLTPDAYRSLMEKQGGACAICKRVPSARLVVDHCHQSGAVRGLLCAQCNAVLGMAGDNIQTMRAAIEYLIERQQPHA